MSVERETGRGWNARRAGQKAAEASADTSMLRLWYKFSEVWRRRTAESSEHERTALN